MVVLYLGHVIAHEVGGGSTLRPFIPECDLPFMSIWKLNKWIIPRFCITLREHEVWNN